MGNLAIDLASVTHPQDQDDELFIHDVVDHTVLTDPNPTFPRAPTELCVTRGSGIVGKLFDGLFNAHTIARVDFAEGFSGRGLIADGIQEWGP